MHMGGLTHGRPDAPGYHVDEVNLTNLKHIINQDGFPTTAMVGLDGVDAAFLLTTHADSDSSFQAKIFKIVTPRLRRNEIDGNQFALLTDRVLVAQGKPQRYGTQFEGLGDQMKPKPIQDEAHVDERRRALGLISIKNYTCVLHAVYDPQWNSPTHRGAHARIVAGLTSRSGSYEWAQCIGTVVKFPFK